MSERNTILAILELGSEPDKLIERITWLSKSFDYRIHLVLFAPEDGALLGGFALSNEADAIRQELHQAQDDVVEEYAQKLRDDGIDVESSVLRQRPLGDGIVEIAPAIAPRIVVKAMQRHSDANGACWSIPIGS